MFANRPGARSIDDKSFLIPTFPLEKLMKKLIIPAVLALLITACSSTPETSDQAAPVETRGDGPAVATVTTGGVDGAQVAGGAHRSEKHSLETQRLFRL
jgi:hypothetical protein